MVPSTSRRLEASEDMRMGRGRPVLYTCLVHLSKHSRDSLDYCQTPSVVSREIDAEVRSSSRLRASVSRD